MKLYEPINKHIINILTYKCNRNSIEIQSKFNRNSIEIQSKFNRNSIEMQSITSIDLLFVLEQLDQLIFYNF